MVAANQFVPRESDFFSDTHKWVLVSILRPVFFFRLLAEIGRTVRSLFFLVWTQFEVSLSQSFDEIHGGATFSVSVFSTGLLTRLIPDASIRIADRLKDPRLGNGDFGDS
jgi:hypothetical protein